MWHALMLLSRNSRVILRFETFLALTFDIASFQDSITISNGASELPGSQVFAHISGKCAKYWERIKRGRQCAYPSYRRILSHKAVYCAND